jgi:CheY-like chemotaxis protein
MVKRPLILVAEDEDNDFFLLNWAFGKHPQKVSLTRAADGVQAIDYLFGANEYSDRARFPLPDLLLLDLKMPRRDGFEVLQAVRSHSITKPLVAIVLSSSRDERDIRRAYLLGANSYLTKPNDTHGFIEVARILIEYWIRSAQRPELNGTTEPQTNYVADERDAGEEAKQNRSERASRPDFGS